MLAAVRLTSGPRRTVTSVGRWPVTSATASCTSRGTGMDLSTMPWGTAGVEVHGVESCWCAGEADVVEAGEVNSAGLTVPPVTVEGELAASALEMPAGAPVVSDRAVPLSSVGVRGGTAVFWRGVLVARRCTTGALVETVDVGVGADVAEVDALGADVPDVNVLEAMGMDVDGLDVVVLGVDTLGVDTLGTGGLETTALGVDVL